MTEKNAKQIAFYLITTIILVVLVAALVYLLKFYKFLKRSLLNNNHLLENK